MKMNQQKLEEGIKVCLFIHWSTTFHAFGLILFTFPLIFFQIPVDCVNSSVILAHNVPKGQWFRKVRGQNEGCNTGSVSVQVNGEWVCVRQNTAGGVSHLLLLHGARGTRVLGTARLPRSVLPSTTVMASNVSPLISGISSRRRRASSNKPRSCAGNA